MGITTPRPDSNTIARYYESDSYISHSNSSKSLFDRTYQISRSFALSWKLSLIKKNTIKKNGHLSLLDYGCGTGHFLKKCQGNGLVIAGVEPSETARRKAEDLTQTKIFEALQTEQQYDVITLWHVLEHIPDVNEQLAQLKLSLKKNGTMFIAVPNHDAKDARHYKEYWAGYDVPRHLWHFNETGMKALLNRHELKLHKIIPMKLDSFYVSMLSEKYISGTQQMSGLVKGIINGLRSNLSARNKNYSSQIFVVRQ
jgi:SAM-dependent methyltransferase